MSPEQVKGEVVDDRSDIFSFGSILYEMLNGQRAFKRNTSAETMTAILNEEPPEFVASTGAIAPALERIVRHCMEKESSQRFQSAHDVAFALESLSGMSQPTTVPVSATRRRRVRSALAGLVLLPAVLVLGVWLRPTATELHPNCAQHFASFSLGHRSAVEIFCGTRSVKFGQTEIEYFQTAATSDEDILGFQIAVDDILLMCCC